MTNQTQPLSAAEENKYRAMTVKLQMTNSKEEVADYIRWIIKSDTAKEYWALALSEKDRELKELSDTSENNFELWKQGCEIIDALNQQCEEKDMEIEELKQIRSDQLEVIKSQRIEIENLRANLEDRHRLLELWNKKEVDMQELMDNQTIENKRLRDAGEKLNKLLKNASDAFIVMRGQPYTEHIDAIEQWKELTK